jgi:hypothetical protein
MKHHANGRPAHTNLNTTSVTRSRNFAPALRRTFNPMGN